MTDDYWTDFVRESEEHITELNNALLALERNPDSGEAMDGIFRIAHTLKGNCGAMGLTRASDLAHALEDLLDSVRTDTVEVSPEFMDTVFDGVDELETMIAEVAADGEIETDPAATIEAIRTQLAVAESGPRRLSTPTDDELEAVLARFDPPADSDHEAYLTRLEIADGDADDGVRVVAALEDAFELLGTDPSLEAIGNREYGAQFDAVFASPVDETAIAAALEPVDAVAGFEIVTVTDRLERSASRDGATIDAEPPATEISTDDAQELSVDELLGEFEEFDDLDAMVEDAGDDDLDVFDEMGEAGSFDDLLGDDDLGSESDPVDETAATTESGATDASTNDVGDAGAVFAELKDEVEMVGFAELQDELDELEFDEFDSDDEVSMEELLGDDADGDDSFLEVDEDALLSESIDDEPIDDESSVADSIDSSGDPSGFGAESEDRADDVTVSFEEDAVDAVEVRAKSEDVTTDDDWEPEFDGALTEDADDAGTRVDDEDRRIEADEAQEDGEVRINGEVQNDEAQTDGEVQDDEAQTDDGETPTNEPADDGFGDAEPGTGWSTDVEPADAFALDADDGIDDDAFVLDAEDDGFDEFAADEPEAFDPTADPFEDDLEASFGDGSDAADEDFGSPGDFESADSGGFDDFEDGEGDDSAAFEPVGATAVDEEVRFEETAEDDSTRTDRIVSETPAMEIPDITVPEPRERAVGEGSDQLQSVRVDVEQIDSLLTLVEGLVTSRVRLRHAIEAGEDRQTIARELDGLESLTSDLQETVMDVRLVPLQTVASRLPRVVRDIAREQEKDVSFEISGEDVELDRSILDRIGDPLIHLVRNAVDHGIEPPDDREAAGKPREGSVEVRASRSRDRVRIVVEDDGSGLDPERLREAAVDAGALTGNEAAALSDADAYDLVFHSGLSTADQVTDVSGRGVGMDVVKRTIERLDGTVTVDSDPNAGTTVTMSLPVTVAIADVLFLECGGSSFGVPIKAVADIEHAGAIDTVDGREILATEDADVPVLHLGEELGLPNAGSSGGMVVRIRDAVRPIALHCDTVSGQQEVVVKPFEGFMADIPGLSGATVRGRGNVVSILDVTTL